MAGKIITIEGLDGVGKSTQIDLMVSRLNHLGVKHKFVHFPMLEKGFYGKIVAEYLRGEFGALNEVHPKLVALIFAEDRNEFKAQLMEWLADDYLIILDRYVHSNIAYQCAKTEGEKDKELLKNWILDFEFNRNQLPRPEMSFFLNVPFSVVENSLKNQREGAERDYLKGKTDIHEDSLTLQKGVMEEYLKMIKEDNTFIKINCFLDEKKWLNPEAIHEKIFNKIIF